MERAILENINSLRAEKEEVERKIKDIERKLEKLEEEGNVKDTVSGGKGGRDHYVIEGYPVVDYDKYVNILLARKALNAKLLTEIEQNVLEAERFIDEITDVEERRIVNLRCIEGLPWHQVARRLGCGNTPDRVRKIFTRMLERA